MESEHAFLSHRLDVIEGKLDAVLQMLADREETEWITTKEVLPLMSVSSRQLTRLITSGVIHGDAIRNVGTIKSPSYRFHRSRLLTQYLKQVITPD